MHLTRPLKMYREFREWLWLNWAPVSVVEQLSNQGKKKKQYPTGTFWSNHWATVFTVHLKKTSSRQGQLRKSFICLTGFVWDWGLCCPVEFYRGHACRHPCADSLYLWERWQLTRNALSRWSADRRAFACSAETGLPRECQNREGGKWCM